MVACQAPLLGKGCNTQLEPSQAFEQAKARAWMPYPSLHATYPGTSNAVTCCDKRLPQDVHALGLVLSQSSSFLSQLYLNRQAGLCAGGETGHCISVSQTWLFLLASPSIQSWSPSLHLLHQVCKFQHGRRLKASTETSC